MASSEGDAVAAQDVTGVAITDNGADSGTDGTPPGARGAMDSPENDTCDGAKGAADGAAKGEGARDDTTSDGSANAAYQRAIAAVDRDEFIADPPLPPSTATVAKLLYLLGPQPGDRVLHVGTGSGYTAAVLSEVVGRHGDVVTTEADVDVASRARDRLIASGRESRYGTGLINVTVLRREPSDVPAPARPWDRVLLDTALPLGSLPYPAIAGMRPGSVLVARIGGAFATGPLVRFEVGPDGIAHGSADPASVGQGTSLLTAQAPDGVAIAAAEVSYTTIDVANLLRHPAWRCAVAIAVPSCRCRETVSGDRPSGTSPSSPRPGVLLDDPVTTSWAHLEQCDAGDHITVRQFGPRHLADEVLTAIRWYADRGAPPLESWTWEAGPDRQCVTIQE